jgi:hypothetical protein
MKQIKVVARNKTSGGDPVKPNNDAMVGGIINVSFNEPITIEAGSRIALDKFFCHITGNEAAQAFATYPDLAIEMSSLDLDSYDSEKRGRRNVVAYFQVSHYDTDPTDIGGFLYEAKILSYLSINNEMDIDIGTIVFRIVNIKTGLALEADYVSFNLLIN